MTTWEIVFDKAEGSGKMSTCPCLCFNGDNPFCQAYLTLL